MKVILYPKVRYRLNRNSAAAAVTFLFQKTFTSWPIVMAYSYTTRAWFV